MEEPVTDRLASSRQMSRQVGSRLRGSGFSFFVCIELQHDDARRSHGADKGKGSSARTGRMHPLGRPGQVCRSYAAGKAGVAHPTGSLHGWEILLVPEVGGQQYSQITAAALMRKTGRCGQERNLPPQRKRARHRGPKLPGSREGGRKRTPDSGNSIASLALLVE